MLTEQTQMLETLNNTPCWSNEAKRLLITILRSSTSSDQITNINSLERALFVENALDAETTALLGTGVLGKIILGRSA